MYVDSKNFAEKRTLTYAGKRSSFLIFMNKAIFLPGDLVQYKIMAINSETRAVSPICASVVSISDGNGNLITSAQNVTFSKGRYANDFQLSNKAGLGLWRIQIQCGDEVR